MIYGLPDKLKLLRTQKNLTQSKVADCIDVTPSVISAYESGERTPSVEKLVLLANLYCVSVDYLLGINYPRDSVILDTSNLNQQQLTALQNLINTMR